ncbi:MAG: MFS transporter [Ardenticatenaceae bacterium]
MKAKLSTLSVETLVLIVAVLGTGMVYLDQTALNVAIPAMQAGLNADIGGVQWIIDIYILMLAALLLIGGVLGDRYGRVRVYAIGMVIFVVASAAGGLAQTVGQMVAARAIQGIGGALLVPGGLAVLNATVAPERRGRLIGTWGSLTSMVVALGPTLGGWLVDNVSWRMVFFINVPLGLLAFVMAMRYVPESYNPEQHDRLDWPGFVSLLLGLGALLFALIEQPHLGWQHPLILSTFLGGLLSLVLFVVIEWRSETPMIQLSLFRHRTFAGINLLTLIHWIALNALFFFLPINLQQIQGFSATQAGLAMLPLSILIVFMAQFSGWAMERMEAKTLILIGLLITGVAFWLFGSMRLIDSYWRDIFPILLVYGVGLGLLFVPLTAVAMSSLPDQYSGVASGVNNAAARVATMLSIALFGSLIATQFHSKLGTQLTTLALDPTTQSQILAHSANLGATPIPQDLPTDLTAAIQQAIRIAFAGSFEVAMLTAAGISVVSVLVLLTFIWPDQP